MIIGISGKLRSGKDTVASLLINEFGPEVCERIALADILKKECEEIYGLDCHRMYTDYAYKEQIRQTLIDHGAYRRAEDIDYWVKLVLERVTKPITLVPDVRYTNEITTIKASNNQTLFIRVESTEDARKDHGWNASNADTDASECQLDKSNDWDLVVQNSGTIKDLRTALKPAIARINTYLTKEKEKVYE